MRVEDIGSSSTRKSIDCREKQNERYCNGNKPKSSKELDAMRPPRSTNEPKHLMMTMGFEVGNAPKSLTDRSQDIYKGTPIDLFDSAKDIVKDLHNSTTSNVFASIYYDQYQDGTISVTSLDVGNYSEFPVNVSRVVLTTQQGGYDAFPTRIVDESSAYLLTVDPGKTASVQLTPSGNSLNPNNRFSATQKLTIFAIFTYPTEPTASTVTFGLTP